jgi:hypothetical protein
MKLHQQTGLILQRCPPPAVPPGVLGLMHNMVKVKNSLRSSFLTLSHLRLQPVRRLPKYQLMFSELRKQLVALYGEEALSSSTEQGAAAEKVSRSASSRRKT